MSLLYFYNVRGQRTRYGIANENWMASQLLLMVSPVVPAFADNKQAEEIWPANNHHLHGCCCPTMIGDERRRTDFVSLRITGY